MNLLGKKVIFWFEDKFIKYESTVVVEQITEENCLTVKDDKDDVRYYIGVDQIQVVKN